jgi:hypothetical protein
MSTVEFKPSGNVIDYLGVAKNLLPGIALIGAAIYYRELITKLINTVKLSDLGDIRILWPLGIIIVCILVVIVSVARGIQLFKGVSRYLVDPESIIIPHAIGSTKIPFQKIDAVTVDELMSHAHTHRTPKGGTKTTVDYTDSAGEPVKIDAGFLLGNAPYTSHFGGKCLLVRLKDKKCIALTPEDPEEMAKVLSEKIGSKSD